MWGSIAKSRYLWGTASVSKKYDEILNNGFGMFSVSIFSKADIPFAEPLVDDPPQTCPPFHTLGLLKAYISNFIHIQRSCAKRRRCVLHFLE